jgi:hypothetical protein
MFLCKLVDVGIKKTIKVGVREKWEDWIMEGGGTIDGATKEPSQE